MEEGKKPPAAGYDSAAEVIEVPRPIIRILSIEPLTDFRLRVHFDDDTGGVVDLSHLVGRGVFARWSVYPEEFDEVSIDARSGAPVWPGGLDVAPDGLHAAVSEVEAG